MARVFWYACREEDKWNLVFRPNESKRKIRASASFETMQERLIDYRAKERDGGRQRVRSNASSHLSDEGRAASPPRVTVLSKASDTGLIGSSAQAFPSCSSSSPVKRRKLSTYHHNSQSGQLQVATGRLLTNLRQDIEHSPESSEDDVREDEVDNFSMYCSSGILSITRLPVVIRGVVCGGLDCPEYVRLIGSNGNDRVILRIAMWRLKYRKNLKPLFLLKTVNGCWLRLRNPAAAYTTVMNEAYILAHFLDFVKKFPSASVTTAQQHLVDTCSKFGGSPSLDRLSTHLRVIKIFAQEDRDIENSSVLRKIFPNFFAKEFKKSLGNGGHKLEHGQHLESMKNWNSDDDSSIPSRVLLQRDGENLEASKLDMEVASHMVEWVPVKSTNPELKKKRLQVMAKKEDLKRRLKVLKYGTKSAMHSGVETIDEDLAVYRIQVPRCTDGDFCVDDVRPVEGVQLDEGGRPDEGVQSDEDGLPDKGVQSDEGGRPDKVVQPHTFTTAELNVEDPPICIICDEGGDLIYCEGPCQRHFHPTKKSGVGSFCNTLCLSDTQVQGMGKYYCENCIHMQHQCFICGELGSSLARVHGHQEVRCCDVPFCKRYYHVECAAEMIAPRSDWQALAIDIHNHNKKLYCPRHCCSLCGQAELKIPGLFVQCRRCPKAWHKSCLLDFSRSGELETTTIWRHHDRDFIYCRNHEIDPVLLTPKRDHLALPAGLPSVRKGKRKLAKLL